MSASLETWKWAGAAQGNRRERRIRTAKKKKEAFCDSLPLNHDNPVDIFLREEGRCPKRAWQSAWMRAAKNDDSGTVIFFLQFVIFSYSHMLGCNSSPMCTDHKGKTGKLLISNTAASAHRDVSPWKPFPANNYAEILVLNGALRDFQLSHANLLREYTLEQVDNSPNLHGR